MSGPAKNTDRELYREDTGDPAGSYYENSVHVTESGAIGMNVGGTVIVQPIAEWHRQALRATTAPEAKAIDLWHRPQPGPGYWDFRCLVCSQRVDDHPPLWARLRRRWLR